METKKKISLPAVGFVVIALVVASIGVVKAASWTISPKIVVQGNLLYNEAAAPVGEPDQNLGSATLAPGQSGNTYEAGLIDATNIKVEKEGVMYSPMPATGAATTTAYLTNATNAPIYLELSKFHVQFSGTASSSVDITCATSTANGIAAYTTTIVNPLVQSFRVPTSTIGASEQGLALATSTRRLAYLASGESLICGWKSPVSNGCTGAFCEAVTSSARGYNAIIMAPYLNDANSQQ